ncbi:hypothetical protein PAXRUDRAFT_29020 [Paxillus rubicundulus Ve08.2h10]|uniref:Uncharacterized protein n=1 Tax=Paxillus rubicundulus Ve08.2h10 TaxID=930991 RepID=A0A0D0DEJ8_9AGAM|nr:hypothetical protein PAXRUDRAFT_29020 [Paxillus rubicundulus Ve08.2h10]
MWISHNLLLGLENELMDLIVNGSLKSFLGNLISTTSSVEMLDDVLEDLILKAVDIQTSTHKIEGDILQQKDVGSLLTAAQHLLVRIGVVITTFEDILMANMDGSTTARYNSELSSCEDRDAKQTKRRSLHLTPATSHPFQPPNNPSNGYHPPLPSDSGACTKKTKKKMNGRSGHEWTTAEQKVWLVAYYETYYHPCLVDRDYSKFKAPFYEAWFQKWPEISSVGLVFPEGTTVEALSQSQHEQLATAIAKHQQVTQTKGCNGG